jgi:hypothetical protein
MKKESSPFRIVPVALIAASILVACASAPDRGTAVGSAHAAISAVPPSIFCVRVTAASAEKLVDVMPGATSTVELDDVPAGQVDFAAFAYGQPCAVVTAQSQPTYASAPTPATILPGQVTALELTLLPVGGAQVGINFGSSDGSAPPDLSTGPDMTAPPFSVSPTSYSWKGTSEPATFTVVNLSNNVLTPSITVPAFSGFDFDPGMCKSVQPGASCTFTITAQNLGGGVGSGTQAVVSAAGYNVIISISSKF